MTGPWADFGRAGDQPSPRPSGPTDTRAWAPQPRPTAWSAPPPTRVQPPYVQPAPPVGLPPAAAGRPLYGAPPSGPPPLGPPPRRQSGSGRALLLIAVVAVLAIAGTVTVLLLSRAPAGPSTAVTSSSAPVAPTTSGSTEPRLFPEAAVGGKGADSGPGDPAAGDAAGGREAAERVARDWIAAFNDHDGGRVRELSCRSVHDQLSDRFIDSIESGSVQLDDVSVTGSRGKISFEYRQSGKSTRSAALSLTVEDESWKVCG